MVDKKLIYNTITELIDANVDKETIKSTLKDIGVDEGDIYSSYNEIINSKKESQKTKNEKDDEHTPDAQKSKKLGYVGVDEISSNKNEDELKETTQEITNINEKQEIETGKDELSKIIPTIPPAQQSTSSNDNKLIAQQISELEVKIDNIKAVLSGLTKIMKDILEENRNILNKL